MVEMTSAQAFERELKSITQPITIEEFINQHVRRCFNNCRLYCLFSNNSLRHIAISIIDSEFNHNLCNVWLMNPIEFSDYDVDSNDGITIRVYDDGLYNVI